ncbi:MAG: PLP-dependent aminotransferase family protein [Anaerolineae bacterium]|nr:PLP-dependent aminotransferase family protein [Anaerolineae bacterium]
MVTLHLSHESANLKRSVIRDLLSVASAPDIISLAGGLPASEYLPIEQYQECLDTVLKREGSRILQYSPQYAPLRAWIAEYMVKRGVTCTPSEVIITNGAQQGLAILSRLLLDPGDPAVIEQITFTGIQQVTVGRGAAVITVPTDLETGVDLDALEKAFQRQPRLAILIPDFHNPLGVSLSLEKRQRIAELSARYEVPVIEDDPYSALRFEGTPLPPIKCYDEEGTIFYLGSFSKMLAPAVRLGWIVAPTDLIPRITALRESFDLESSILTQTAVYEFLAHGWMDEHLRTFNAANLVRRNALINALQQHFGGEVRWTEPEGGLFMWVTFPETVNTWEVFDQAVKQKVVYVPGGAFAVEGGYTNTMRLNFSNARPEIIQEAISRLATVIQATPELL